MRKKDYTRDNEIDVLLDIISKREAYQENSKNGLVILLNGAWGSGKTTLLKLLEDRILESEVMDLFVHYDAFEYDFYDTPYIPFFSSMEDKLKLGDTLDKIVNLKNCGKGIMTLAYTLVNAKMKEKFNIDMEEARDIALGFQNENYKKDFDELKKCKEDIVKKIKDTDKTKIKVFIIDELDRCKPDFAIETLEIIKHFFDIENCVFIVSVDKIQLEESAKTIFGQDMDSEKYFSKFFDYQFNLLEIPFYEAVHCDGLFDSENLVNEISEIFNILNVSLRDSKKIFNEFVLIYRKYNNEGSSDKWTDEQCYIIIFFLILKYTDLLFYKEFIRGNYDTYLKKMNESNIQQKRNYTKFLNRKIDGAKNYSSILSKLGLYLEREYVDLKKVNIHYINEDPIYSLRKKESKEMNKYIPQVLPDKSYRINIEKIIN